MKASNSKDRAILCLVPTLFLAIGVSCAATPQTSPEAPIMKESTYIPFQAKSGQSDNLEALLKQGAKLVAQTEPNTLYWYALRNADGGYGIFDLFPNEEGRAEHFSGQTAAALKANATELVHGAWDDGIVANIANASVLSYKAPSQESSRATEATYILLKANSGQEQALEDLLTGAAQLIAETEPHTLLWVSLKLDDNTFGIFDTFSDDAGRQAHFAGQVAAALKAQAEELVAGGWDNGVLANVRNFRIIAEAGK